MRKSFKMLCFSCIIIFVSCQKSIEFSERINNTGSNARKDNLLVKAVSLWSQTSQPGTDSSITEYSYNDSGALVTEHGANNYVKLYTRDENQRIIKLAVPQNSTDTAFMYVTYVNASSHKVAFEIIELHTSMQNVHDSVSFSYQGDHVAKTEYYSLHNNEQILLNYETFAFDSKGNVTEIKYMQPDGTFNIGYEFIYDDKSNPYYQEDDARLPTDWGYILSPNNITKQLNHYGGASPSPDDYVTYSYKYNSGGFPLSRFREGTAIGTATENVNFYYR